MLDKKITRARSLLPDIIATGGVCDAYQPAEREFKITKKVFSVLKKHKWPCFILTKSDLILRDIDLLKAIFENSYLCVAFTINTTSDNSARYFEPFSPSPSKRFKALAKLKSNGLYAGICAMPILPYIWDSEEQLDNLFKHAKEAGADFILFSSLTLGESMKDDFYTSLDNCQIGLSNKYKEIFFKGSYAK
jgi:DNA repair photolyase